MNTIEIRKEDFNFLLKSKIEKDILNNLEENCTAKYDSIYLNLSEGIIVRVLDFLGDELAQNGFNEDDEPNEFGVRIENLIDKFSKAIYH
jgi:hypothetical protein